MSKIIHKAKRILPLDVLVQLKHSIRVLNISLSIRITYSIFKKELEQGESVIQCGKTMLFNSMSLGLKDHGNE